jgi:hypothetical protein
MNPRPIVGGETNPTGMRNNNTERIFKRENSGLIHCHTNEKMPTPELGAILGNF